MDITHSVRLDNNDIEAAIKLFLDANGVSTVDQDIKIDLTAGRKGKGHYAHINLEPSVETDDSKLDTETEEEEEVLDAVAHKADTPPETSDEEEETNNSLFS